MEQLFGTFILSAFLVVCAGGMLFWQIRSWKSIQLPEMEPAEREFRRRQFRRRMQTTVLMVLVGASLPIGHWIVLNEWGKVALVFWGVVVFLLLWVGVLAFSDIWATKFYFGRVRDRYQLEQTRLQAELRMKRAEMQAQMRQAQQAFGNGKSNGNGHGE